MEQRLCEWPAQPEGPSERKAIVRLEGQVEEQVKLNNVIRLFHIESNRNVENCTNTETTSTPGRQTSRGESSAYQGMGH